MKTETICGKEVLRVDGSVGTCVMEHKGTKILRCAFLTGYHNCGAHAQSEGAPCGFKRTIFIRPDQLNDYLAIKLVT